MSTSPLRLGVIATLLIVAGLLAAVTAPAPSFGWFAYAPLSDEVYTGHGLFTVPALVGGRQLLGLGVVVTGLVIAGLGAGIWLGRRQLGRS